MLIRKDVVPTTAFAKMFYLNSSYLYFGGIPNFMFTTISVTRLSD